MISIIFTVLGVMFILTGLGLRPLVKAFGITFAGLGVIFLLDALMGYLLQWSPHMQLWIAVGALGIFTVVATVWQLMVKFKEMKKMAERLKKKE
jgi:uncharacterized membrane protein HdeD (DUF308 family)